MSSLNSPESGNPPQNESKDGLRSILFDQIHDPILIFRVREDGEPGCFIDINEAACRYFEYSRTDLLNMSPSDLNAPESPDGVYVPTDDSGDIPVTSEVLHMTGRGRRLPGEITVRCFMSDEGPAAYMIVRDISAHKKDRERFQAAYDKLEHRFQERTLALVESERRFRSIVHSSPMGLMLFQLAPDGRLVLTDSNPSMDTITGVATSDLYGRALEDAFPEIACTDLSIHFRAAASHGLSRHTDHFEYSNGLSTGIYEVFSFQTTPGCMAAVFKDVTARKAAEAEREKAHLTMQAVLDSLPQQIYAADRDTYEILFANQKIKQEYGDKIIGRPCWEVFYNSDTPCEHCRTPKIVNNGSLAWEVSKGKDKFLTIGTIVDWIDGRPARVQVSTDVTELSAAREAVSEAEARYHRLVQDTVIGMFRSTVEGELKDANPALARIFGYDSPQQMLKEVSNTKTLHAHADSRKTLIQNTRPSYDNLIGVDALMRRRDGETFWVRVYARAIPDAHGNPEFYEGFFMDINSQKTLEQSLREEKKRAEDANRAKSAFLANMSHEIRTPLNGVMGMLQLMRLAASDEERENYIKIAINSGRNLLALISDILDLSRIEAGRMEIRTRCFKIRDVLDSITDTFIQTASEKGLKLGLVMLPGTPETLCGDAGRLRQILFNLVGNGIKFTEKGSVTTEIGPAAPYDEKRIRLIISVSDTGIGIPENLTNTIFEPFTQADDSRTRNFQGAGLGLSIVRRLVEVMGGKLALESIPERGTTIHVILPFDLPDESELPALESEPKKAADAPRPLKLLLAEDDRINQLTAGKFLEKLGHSVTLATNGPETLKALSRGSFDALLLDVQMPEIDGLEVTRRIRENKDRNLPSDIPILGVTAHAMSGDHERFVEVGMDDCLTKPLDLEKLRDTLTRLVFPSDN